MGRGSREIIKLFSSAGTGHFYSTTKSKRGQVKKIKLRKFDPKVRRHVEYTESK